VSVTSDFVRHHALLIVAAGSIAAAAALSGSALAIAAALISLPAIAWRYDNRTGVFLPLAILLLIVVGVLAALLGLLAIIHD
jgi:hypothetical protein